MEDGGVRFCDRNGWVEIFGGGKDAKDSLRVRKIWAGNFHMRLMVYLGSGIWYMRLWYHT